MEDVELSVLKPHIPDSAHQNFRLPNSIEMISSNARNLSLITDDLTTKSTHIANNEHIDQASWIPYLQGHCPSQYLKSHVFGNPTLGFQKIGTVHAPSNYVSENKPKVRSETKLISRCHPDTT